MVSQILFFLLFLENRAGWLVKEKNTLLTTNIFRTTIFINHHGCTAINPHPTTIFFTGNAKVGDALGKSELPSFEEMTAAAVGNDAGTAMLKCYTDNCAELDGIVTVNAGSSISAGIATIVGVVAAMMM